MTPLKIGGYNGLIHSTLQKFGLTYNPRPNCPAIRFNGFTEPWEEKALENVFDFSLPHFSLSRDQLNYDFGEVLNIHYGDILTKFGSIAKAGFDYIPYITDGKMSEYKKARLLDGDVIFADTAEDETVGKAIEIRTNNNLVVAGLHTFVARPIIEFAPYFQGYYLNSNAYHSQLLPLMQGIKVLSINKSAIGSTIVRYPKSIDEQKKIGDFFYNFDELISSKQQEIVKHKTIKQSLFGKMFVN